MNALTLKKVEHVATLLVIIGSINWGLVGLGGFMNADWNVVNLILGVMPQVEWAVYVLVGVAGVWLLWDWYSKLTKK